MAPSSCEIRFQPVEGGLVSPDHPAIDPRTSAKAAGLERWFRSRTIDLINRVVVALMTVGGLATAMSLRTPGAMLPTALVSLGVGHRTTRPAVLRNPEAPHHEPGD
ncbi:MAG TPA: hypothetical protein VMV96_02180 [Acidimicrobiales bacterium]|nr:hypothetical protein [Acidimicrobiales bacterium]